MPDRYFRRLAFGRLEGLEGLAELIFWPFEHGIPRLWRKYKNRKQKNTGGRAPEKEPRRK